MTSYQNYIPMALLVTITLISFWFTGSAACKYYHYNKLNTRTYTTDISWSVIEVNDERFLLNAHYHYTLAGKTYEGHTTFSHLPYRNKEGADHAIKEYDAKRWPVWYDKMDNGHSSLEKRHPTKEVVYAVIMWGLVVYFIWFVKFAVKKQF